MSLPPRYETWALVTAIVLLGIAVCIPQMPAVAVGVAACFILFAAGVLVGRWLP